MGSLYERILSQHPTQPRLPVNQFTATAAEWARGRITGTQAQDMIASFSNAALDAVATQEAQDLVATVTSLPDAASQVARMAEIDQIFLLADANAPNYDTPAKLRARLGVPTR